MGKQSKADKAQRNRLMIGGLQKNYTAKDSIPVGGVATPQPQIIASLQAETDAGDRTATAEAAFHKAVADEEAAGKAADTTFLDLKHYFLATLKNAPDKLKDYGLELPTKKTPSTATKAAAAAKQKATRALRGTKGKRQKAAIKATTPATASATPAPATPATKS
jgi:hypothetical protein